MAGVINKGIVTNIKDNTVRVNPCDATGRISAEITVPWHLREKTGELKKGTEVVYVLFDDQSGILLGRMDGDWGECLPSLSVDNDITAGSISLKNHTHGGVAPGPGNTSMPQ